MVLRESHKLPLRPFDSGLRHQFNAPVSRSATNGDQGNWNENAGSNPVWGSILEMIMTTTYQYDDGKIIFVYNQDNTLKLINVVHDNLEVANKVADAIVARLKSFGE